MLCCLRNQVWVWPGSLLWRPILGFWGFTEKHIDFFFFLGIFAFTVSKPILCLLDEKRLCVRQLFGAAWTYYLSLSSGVCLFVCGAFVYVCVWWPFFTSMLKWPLNFLFEDIRLEILLQKAFHLSKHHAGKKKVFKIKKDFPSGWRSKMF